MQQLRILAETDRAAAGGGGGIAAVLRREGLYSSNLTDWRRARDAGAISGLNPAKRGPKIAQPNPLAADNARLRQDNADLTLRLTRAEAIIDIQKSCVPAGYTPGPQRQRALTGAIVALAPA